MAQPKKEVTTDVFDTKIEALKSMGFEVAMALLHQSTTLFGRTERTISTLKYPGIKLWLTSAGLLCEFGGKLEIVPAAGVAKAQL